MKIEVAVLGGGLGGLACATLLARRGARVALFERSRELGGRGRSRDRQGFVFDQGPHALYAGGPAERTLRALEVPIDGRCPAAGGSLALRDGALHTLPVGLASLVSTDLLGLGEKTQVAWLLARLGGLDARAVAGKTVRTWIESTFDSPNTRALMHALVRVSSYTNAPDLLDASFALRRMQQVFTHNVIYLDDGWRSLVGGLRASAERAGVEIVLGAEPALERDGDRVSRVRVGDHEHPVDAVVLATGPRAAHALAPWDEAIADATARATPVCAAVLQVALRALPSPERRFAIGMDAPLYYAVPSLTARVAPDGAHAINVAKYLPVGAEHDGARDEAELFATLDMLQPGWREHEVATTFLPSLVVANELPKAAEPRVARASTPNVGLVGDWVDSESTLLDGVLASANAAANAILGQEDTATAA